MQSARKALERARGARLSGDAAHARMLEELALEWVETARDLQRGSDAETSATQLARRARDIATQIDRARALLSETQDRRGRAAAELDRLDAEAREATNNAARAEESRTVSKGAGAPVTVRKRWGASKSGRDPAPPDVMKPAKPKSEPDSKRAPKKGSKG